jgi:DNA-binding XRE family transcriptional regulator
MKQLRAAQGISHNRLSKLADLSLNTVVTVESGANENPTIDTLIKIAKTVARQNELRTAIDEIVADLEGAPVK